MAARNTDEDFWSRVDRSAGPDACWPWTGRRKPPARGQDAGYGIYDHDGTYDRAHRYAFFLTHGYMPKVCRHTCDNPPCCNPAHLLDGTQLDNVRDRDERGRRDVRGGRHPRALFDDEQVAMIRELASSGRWTPTAIARELGSKVSTIHKIIRRRSYGHTE